MERNKENEVETPIKAKISFSGLKKYFAGIRARVHDYWNPVADTGYEYALPFSNYEGSIDSVEDLVEDMRIMRGTPIETHDERG